MYIFQEEETIHALQELRQGAAHRGQVLPILRRAVEQEGVNDETAVFTTLPDELNGPIDLSAFDAAMKDAIPQPAAGAQDGVTTGDPLAATDPHIPAPDELPPVETPPVRRAAGTHAAPRTTYFGTPDPDDRPYRKPSKGKKAAVIVVIVLIIAALIGGGVWFFLSRQPDESLTLAEQYMARGDFDKALEYYTAARAEASDPTSIDATIQLLRDYQAAQDYVDNGQYTEAVAALKQLQNRVTDPNPPRCMRRWRTCSRRRRPARRTANLPPICPARRII